MSIVKCVRCKARLTIMDKMRKPQYKELYDKYGRICPKCLTNPELQEVIDTLIPSKGTVHQR